MTASRFTRREDVAADRVSMTLDGHPIKGRAGDTVAAVILAHDGAASRHTGVSSAPRTPFCMMGVCFECLVIIDGKPNQQACMIMAAEGMAIRRQSGFRKLESDQ